MRLPNSLNRKAVKRNFDKLANETWDYLFDHDRGNGLFECRTQGWGCRHIWYDTDKLKSWLASRSYYSEDDYNSEGNPIKTRITTRGMNVTRHVLV